MHEKSRKMHGNHAKLCKNHVKSCKSSAKLCEDLTKIMQYRILSVTIFADHTSIPWCHGILDILKSHNGENICENHPNFARMHRNLIIFSKPCHKGIAGLVGPPHKWSLSAENVMHPCLHACITAARNNRNQILCYIRFLKGIGPLMGHTGALFSSRAEIMDPPQYWTSHAQALTPWELLCNALNLDSLYVRALHQFLGIGWFTSSSWEKA